MAGVLQNVRVLDLGRYIAGPFCAALLGDFGADVIRVERPEGGEDRFLYPQTPQGDGATFLQSNRNKRGMTLDLKHPKAAEALRRLVASADVVVVNLPQPTLVSLGLDYEALCKVRPDIILAAVSAFGPSGPYSERVGFDGVAQSMSGAAYLTGFDGQPVRSFANWADVSTALLAALGVMAALRDRDRTGRGQEVRGNLLKSAMTVMNAPLIEQQVSRKNRVAQGNRGPTGGPVDIFRTRDGWIMVQVLGGALFRRWSKLIGEPHWLDDPRFQDDTGRGDNGAVISARTQAWCDQYTSAEALERLAEARLPAGPVLSPQQVLDDAHVAAADFIQEVEYPGAAGPIPYVRPVELSAHPAEIARRPPLLGEHNHEILGELGFSAAEITDLQDSKAI
ncbi:CoA transferase [Phenylobacterium sp.]|jgi:crotonobetainyl-CoA:carnitine CoA-transferase CaiB-like acyl-CoA transferase|uniref:CaiB/BaiF CoA transferase family protein n=1 Tax=Phenylobacterium sp. TaxID=1871053 RepID=UPI002F423189